ncbi:Pentafunctional AROM polypeptide [Lasiodiplodia hormozganensis]|uniref:Pentafunctional AROM polypeptide n=1 Tax=Lasiodiplodia hormozganensis TaxID=869390 RepID=A0AA40CKM9_9PEZI|nr:Pentafunctional AROM polypeptide [Lasiodiplodia hormozganensis]
MGEQPRNESGSTPESHSTKRNFYIFGHNISHSLSPALHNAGFKELGLPHHYSIHQSEAVDESVEQIINRPDFGGASVTYPHKLQVGRLLSSLSRSAERIGAVNTIVVRDSNGQRVLEGDNTDWLGIKSCIETSKVGNFQFISALILGAGGAARAACYAVQTLGVSEIVVVNRTKEKAVQMMQHFPGTPFRVYGNLEELAKEKRHSFFLIVPCIPADDLTEEKIPKEIFSEGAPGVLVEMAYRPQVTGMMKVAEAMDGWKVFRGTDVLEEQAYAQFTLWTGKPAPVSAMREGMHAAVAARA